MAIDLKLNNPVQSNDAKTIVVTDNTGSGVTGWGGSNPAVTDVDNVNYSLTLTIVVTRPEGETTYDAINLYTEFGPFALVEDLVFTLTPDMLVSGGSPMGASGTEFLDGWYKFTYTLTEVGVGVTDTMDVEHIIDGNIRILMYDKMRVLQDQYNVLPKDINFENYQTLIETLWEYFQFKSYGSPARSGNKTKVVGLLEVLEDILIAS